MPKRMLIDASHPEETRVVVLDGQKVEEFDFESASKRPLKGNIYLAKVTRVEPSLQAAFVEYGGNRQGFLAFSEIHPDYYQIPIADRMALLAEQEAEAKRRAAEDSEFVETAPVSPEGLMPEPQADADETETDQDELHENDEEDAESGSSEAGEEQEPSVSDEGIFVHNAEAETSSAEPPDDNGAEITLPDGPPEQESEELSGPGNETQVEPASPAGERADEPQTEPQETDEAGVGSLHAEGQAGDGAPQSVEVRPLQHRPSQRWTRRRHYKIQEVIKRRQILLVQVVKEERGNKGAALTTFLSLPGRYCVLMPNTPRGGGISRKITNQNDRKRLKSAVQSLELPEGMGLIIRTAGESRTKTEIKRDYEYLLRLWDSIRELTLKSNAPACVYEEGDLIKRSIRDLYNKDIIEVVVEGDEGYRNAKEFMRMIMPSHAKNVKPYKEPLPLFQRHHIEAQLDAMFSPIVHLKSGGYIVINQTEALVSIDVNSGRATREHSIEETAHKTNLEAADEIARQLRLRDLAGLIVIDFIDMEDSRNDRDVEKRLYNAVKNDRARIQIGRISQFGLLEMSRQRLRAGVIAGSTVPCPHCGGQGIVRSVESTTLRVLRALEEEGQRQRAAALTAYVPSEVAIYALNQKRREIARIEAEYDIKISIDPKEGIIAGTFEIVRTATRTPEEIAARQAAISPEAGFAGVAQPESDQADEAETEEAEEETEAEESIDQPQAQEPQQRQGEGRRRRRRRRRGRGRDHGSREDQPHAPAFAASGPGADVPIEFASPPGGETMPIASAEPIGGEPRAEAGNGDGGRRRRRRRRRGRRHRREGETNFGQQSQGNFSPETRFGRDEFEIDTTPRPETPRASQEAPADFSTAPNPSSTPVWSLSQEKREPDRTEPGHASKEDHKRDEPAEPARKGWWQRTFRS